MWMVMLIKKIKQTKKKSDQPTIRKYKVGERVQNSKISKIVDEALLENQIAVSKLRSSKNL